MNGHESMKPLLQQDDGPQFCAHPIRHKAGDESTRFIRSIPNPPPADPRVAHPDIGGSKP
jgi:hypothetical protein